eukprot:TRINITY_DN36851_c0_g1_i2.p1 TRINITY_DN36851_c0_g1~~TRINITY_DN36851_c0_g1_i2.p1  ORF type:complete len:345 (-),score=62.39 TRINITY_DN36851_c0_g1_i2:58-1038(-)
MSQQASLSRSPSDSVLARTSTSRRRPKYKVVPLHDAAHIALREERLKIQLTKHPEPLKYGSKDPGGLFAELDQLLDSDLRSSLEGRAQDKVTNRQARIEEDMREFADLAKRAGDHATFIANDVPLEPPRDPDLPPHELYERLDRMASGETPFSRKSNQELDERLEELKKLREKTTHTIDVLDADLEAINQQLAEAVAQEPQETPAEFVQRNPGPALKAAYASGTLFTDIDGCIPKSKKKAREMLMRTGVLEVHKYVEDNLNMALDRKDAGKATVQKVLKNRDQVANSHVAWSQRTFSALKSEIQQRRAALALEMSSMLPPAGDAEF